MSMKKHILAPAVAAALLGASAADAAVVGSIDVFNQNATIAAGAAQNPQQVGGFTTTKNTSGLAASLAYQPTRSPLVLSGSFSRANGTITTQTYGVAAGYVVSAFPRLLVTPRVELGQTFVALHEGEHNGSSARANFVGAGVDAAVHVSPRLTMSFGGSLGRTFQLPFLVGAGAGRYETAEVGLAVAVGPGAITVGYRYAYTPMPTTSGIALTTRRASIGYALPF